MEERILELLSKATGHALRDVGGLATCAVCGVTVTEGWQFDTWRLPNGEWWGNEEPPRCPPYDGAAERRP